MAASASCLAGVWLAALLVAPSPAAGAPPSERAPAPASTLRDISGLAWLGDDRFLAVHDGKNDEVERGQPRVSLLLLPADQSAPPDFARRAAGGLHFRELTVDWTTDPPNDLESIARIPGTRQVLLVESGANGSAFQRIFLATFNPPFQLVIDEVVPWPTPVFNVEASAVFEREGQLFFVYAERADGKGETAIRWARMQRGPLRFGPFSSVVYAAPLKGRGVRPIVALDVDSSGWVYAASAFDPGVDSGPFRSFVSRIGRFRGASKGEAARFVPSRRFADVARQDGFKIEGVAVMAGLEGADRIYAGTDDEDYGACLRQVWPIEGAGEP